MFNIYFLYLFPKIEKRFTNFGQNVSEIRDRYGHEYICILDKEEHFFEKCLSVRPSALTQKLCTLKLKNEYR